MRLDARSLSDRVYPELLARVYLHWLSLESLDFGPAIPRKAWRNLVNIHLHCLVLEGIYRSTGDEALFHEARAPTRDALQGLLEKIVMRLMRLLTRRGYLVEEQGMTCLTAIAADDRLKPLQAASCTYRIAFGARAGQKMLSLRTAWRAATGKPALPAFAPMRTASACMPQCAPPAHQRKRLERLCRYISRPAITNERLSCNGKGQVRLPEMYRAREDLWREQYWLLVLFFQ